MAFWPSFVTAHTCTCCMIMEQLYDLYEYFLSTLTAQLSMGGGGEAVSKSSHFLEKLPQSAGRLCVGRGNKSFFKNGGAASVGEYKKIICLIN